MVAAGPIAAFGDNQCQRLCACDGQVERLRLVVEPVDRAAGIHRFSID